MDAELRVPPAPVLRAKFRVAEISRRDNGGAEYQWVRLYPVFAEDGPNKTWAQATPGGSLEMTISNPAAFGRLELGKEYLLDFTPAES